MRRKRLGRILMGAGLITEDQLRQALTAQATSERIQLGRIFIEKGWAKEEDICQALAAQFNLPYVKLKEVEIPQEVVQTISREVAVSKLVIAYRKTGRRLQ